MTKKSPNSTHSKKVFARQVIGIVISIVCLALVFRKVDFGQIKAAVENFRWHYLVAGLLALTMDYSIRIIRWAVMLRAGGATIASRNCAAPFLGSITLNNVLPFRAGDVVRALVFPAALGISRVTATASLVFERLIDMLTLLACLGIGVLVSSSATIPEWLQKSVVLLSVAGCTALLLIAILGRYVVRLLAYFEARIAPQSPKAAKVIATVADLVGNTGAMSRLSVLLPVVVLSACIWTGETGLFWSILHGLNIDVDFPAALMIMAVTTLSTLVPSSPGYVGPFHFAAYTMAVMSGSSPSAAASFAVLSHLALWIPTTVAGGIAILLKPSLFAQRKAVENTF
ncbi:lysylphosphatidylglycerol synthase transmembrane domain-containing protein [Paraburkholderia sp. J12]|uniref:lysylphosphatidylglycerol synthase transmembrane domain-containing protein n=1 Tax=Paraburkholderia sp. J12 TaxID=2805432 RepID=UPI002ABDC706|nr:lysylphosphatidylglycerol synthase transmembrane domain-containing protein [Paraburkholderia sp. J12]